MLTEEKKKEKVALAISHAEADRLASGFFTHAADNRGCSVGCDAYDIRAATNDTWDLNDGPSNGYHSYVAIYFGTPEWLEHLRDAVFEGLPGSQRSGWHVDLAKALPVSSDFEPIRHKIQRDILLEVAAKSIGAGDEEWRVKCRAAVQSVAALHDKSVSVKVSDEEWSAAEWSATRSAEAAAMLAEAAAMSARSAAMSARSAMSAMSARSAAMSARSAMSARAAAMSARSARSAYQTIAEITLRHLRAAREKAL